MIDGDKAIGMRQGESPTLAGDHFSFLLMYSLKTFFPMHQEEILDHFVSVQMVLFHVTPRLNHGLIQLPNAALEPFRNGEQAQKDADHIQWQSQNIPVLLCFLCNVSSTQYMKLTKGTWFDSLKRMKDQLKLNTNLPAIPDTYNCTNIDKI